MEILDFRIHSPKEIVFYLGVKKQKFLKNRDSHIVEVVILLYLLVFFICIFVQKYICLPQIREVGLIFDQNLRVVTSQNRPCLKKNPSY